MIQESHLLKLIIGNINKEYNKTHDSITNITIEMCIANSLTNIPMSEFNVELTQIQGDDQSDTNMIEKQISIFNMFVHNIACNIDDTIYFQKSSICGCTSGIKIHYCANQRVIVIMFKSDHYNFLVSILSELCNL